MKRRIFCLLLTVLILAAMLPLPTAHAERTQVTLSDLRAKFPAGKYWNHHGGSNNPDGYSDTPCAHVHGDCNFYGACGCNSFDSAIQCLGYAYKLGYDYYGTSVKTWPKVYNLDSVKPGDVLRYRDDRHSVFVTAVTDTTITYTDCNSDRHCLIRWDVTVSRADLARLLTHVSVAPYAAVEGLPPEGPVFRNTQSTYRQRDTVNFRWSAAEENESYRLTVLLDGKELFSRNLSSSLSFALRLDSAGSYTAKLCGTNEFGASEEAVYEFTVLERKPPAGGWLSVADNPVWIQRGLGFLRAGHSEDPSESSIDPALSLNRAMLATLLWRAAGCPEATDAHPEIPEDQWYSGSAAWAKENGLIDSGEGFDPDAVVTREQLAVALFRYAGRFGSVSGLRADLSSYPDAAVVCESAMEAMQWAVATGLIAASGSGGIVYLAPKDAVTGEEAALALARCLQKNSLPRPAECPLPAVQ